MDKNKKIIVNLGVSIVSQCIILILGFVIPRIIMSSYGSDTNGLTSTITQIFTYMALLEAGISQATRNKLFKPIKEDNREEISYWMSVSRRYFRKISVLYFCIVSVIAFVFPLVLKTHVGYWTIVFYILFEGLTSVVSFYFINTWVSFLTAKGDMYVVNSLSLLNKVLCYSVKIILALLGINIALIQVGYFVVSIFQVMLYFMYMKKKYNWIDYTIPVKDVVLPDRRSYIITEITWTIFSSTDMILLSVFMSTEMASVYSVYSLPFVALNSLLNAVYCALNYNLGITYHENIPKYMKVHDMFNSLFVGGMTILMSVTYIMLMPFIKLYTQGINDVNYIYPILPLLFCLVQMLSWSRIISGNLIGVAGRIKPAVKINVIEALANLVLSLAFIQKWGIVGVLMATVLALPLKVVYCNFVSDRKILKRSGRRTISILGINYFIFIITALISSFIDLKIESYASFALYGMLTFCIICVISSLLNVIVNRDLLDVKMLLKRRGA